MKTTPFLLAAVFLHGCGGQTPSGAVPKSETSIFAEAPIGMLKNLAKRLDSTTPSDRKKASEEIAKLGPRARPMQQRLKEAIAKETDAAVKAALADALEKTGERPQVDP